MKETLTLSQNQIGTFSQMVEGDYSIGVDAIFKGEVDSKYFSKTLETIIHNNDIFNLKLVKKDVEIFQELSDRALYTYKIKEFQSFEEFDDWKHNARFQQIDLDYLIDFYGIIIKDYGFGIFFKVHHIISDAFSVGLLVNEFIFTYRDYEKNLLPSIERGSYQKVLDAENDYKLGKKINRDKEFWVSEFKNKLTSSYLSNKKSSSYRVHRQSFSLSKKHSEQLQEYAKRNNVSELFIYMSAFSIYMSRMNREDIVNIGTTLHSRFGKNQKNTMGMFVNTVPISISINKENDFTEFISQVDKRKSRIFKHSKFNYTTLKQELNEKYGFREDLFDVIINYQTAKKEFSDEFKISWQNCQYQSNNLTISLNSWEDGTFKIDFDYLDDVFTEEEIKNINRHVNNILFNGLANPTQKISSLKMADEVEDSLYKEINKLDNVNFENNDIKTIFENVCEKNSNRIAVIQNNEKITYSQLNELSNKLARVLLKKGIGKGDSVAVISDRNIQLIINILSVIKIGARYIPIDPNYPEERINYMLTDSGTKAILLSTDNVLELNGDTAIDVRKLSLDGESGANLDINISPEDQLYVIYTSGTTGKPKGVKISHINVVRLLFHDNNRFSFSNRDVWMLFHYYGFDFSVWEIFGAILNGGMLVVPSLDEIHDNYLIIELIKKHQVTVLNQVPSSFYALMYALGKTKLLSLRYLIFGGEALEPLKLRDFYLNNGHVNIINMYGITEATVHVTYKKIESSEIEQGISNIGCPLPTTGLYLMNDDVVSGIGVPGEICVYGKGLSSGYLNNTNLTHEKFVFSDTLQRKIYRSGDLARLLPDGTIEYMGRIDKQVKIHGFRIELKEIEGQILRKFERTIEDCIVIDKKDRTGETSLYAYFIKKPIFNYDNHSLSRELREVLPSYMIPKYWIELSEFPLTNNGKLDKSQLPDIKIESTGEIDEASTEKEKEILNIFRDLLGNDSLGIHDDFFEFGGDSIKNMMLVSKMRNIGLEVTTKEVVQNPTVVELSNVCRTRVLHDNQLPVYGEIQETPIISDFFNSNYDNPEYYNQSILLKCNKKISQQKVKNAFLKIIEQHDMLRAVVNKDRLFVSKYDEHDLDFESIRLEKEEMIQFFNKTQESFQFDGSTLFKIRLIEMGDEDYVFLVAHHLIIDAVSWRVILDDLNYLYDHSDDVDVDLPLKSTSFKQWAMELNEYKDSSAFKNQSKFWDDTIVFLKKQNKSELDTFNFRKDSIFIDNEVISDGMNRAKEIFGADSSAILLAALLDVLTDYLPNKTIINMEGHGRTLSSKNIAVERTVGWFTAIYPLVVEKQFDISSSIMNIKDKLKRASQSQIEFGLMKNKDRFTYRPNLTFNYLGEFTEEINNSNTFSLSKQSTGEVKDKKNYLKSDFVVDIINYGDGFNFNFTVVEKININFEKVEMELKNYFLNLKDKLNCYDQKVITQSDVSDEELESEIWKELTDLYN